MILYAGVVPDRQDGEIKKGEESAAEGIVKCARRCVLQRRRESSGILRIRQSVDREGCCLDLDVLCLGELLDGRPVWVLDADGD